MGLLSWSWAMSTRRTSNTIRRWWRTSTPMRLREAAMRRRAHPSTASSKPCNLTEEVRSAECGVRSEATGLGRSHQKVCVNGTVDFDPGRQFEFISDVKWTDLN